MMTIMETQGRQQAADTVRPNTEYNKRERKREREDSAIKLSAVGVLYYKVYSVYNIPLKWYPPQSLQFPV